MSVCQSFRASALTCADGFVQRPLCSGNTCCPMCGTVSSSRLPDCLRDEVPAHLSRDDGSPLFYRAALAAEEGDKDA